jgi:hypothetical protein
MEGLKITLSGAGHGLSRDKHNRELFPHPFVFQCGPMETYTIAHTFNFGTYDTIDNDQFSRRGSRQLTTWQFDTLAMYLGTDQQGRYAPHWVPFPRKEKGGVQYHRPEWYRAQLRHIFKAGEPFKYTASEGNLVIHSLYATLTAFNEEYRAGEGDAIYLTGVSFQEWRDPRGQPHMHKPKHHNPHLPAHIRFKWHPAKSRWLAYDLRTGKEIKVRSSAVGHGTTFADLARHYYHDGAQWRHIAQANHCHGKGGDMPIVKGWFNKRMSHGRPTLTLKIPTKPEHHQHKPAHQAKHQTKHKAKK